MTNKQTKTIGSVRLLPAYWIKLRKVWKELGSAWLEKAIDREYKRITGDKK